MVYTHTFAARMKQNTPIPAEVIRSCWIDLQSSMLFGLVVDRCLSCEPVLGVTRPAHLEQAGDPPALAPALTLGQLVYWIMMSIQQ